VLYSSKFPSYVASAPAAGNFLQAITAVLRYIPAVMTSATVAILAIGLRGFCPILA
jgi:hypothetical protein